MTWFVRTRIERSAKNLDESLGFVTFASTYCQAGKSKSKVAQKQKNTRNLNVKLAQRTKLKWKFIELKHLLCVPHELYTMLICYHVTAGSLCRIRWI